MKGQVLRGNFQHGMPVSLLIVSPKLHVYIYILHVNLNFTDKNKDKIG